MLPNKNGDAFRFTEEEAFAILGLCLTSPNKLDDISERALRKLADYCSRHQRGISSNHSDTQQVAQRVS